MEDFNIDYIDILMFCQNKINSTKLKQMTKGWTCEGQKSHANQHKILWSVCT